MIPAKADHLRIGKTQGQKSAGGPARSDADEKEAGMRRAAVSDIPSWAPDSWRPRAL